MSDIHNKDAHTGTAMSMLVSRPGGLDTGLFRFKAPVEERYTPADTLFGTIEDGTRSFFGYSGAHDGDDLRLCRELAVDKLDNYRGCVRIGVETEDDDVDLELETAVANLEAEMLDTAIMQTLADVGHAHPATTPAHLLAFWATEAARGPAHYLIASRWRTLFNTDEENTHAR